MPAFLRRRTAAGSRADLTDGDEVARAIERIVVEDGYPIPYEDRHMSQKPFVMASQIDRVPSLRVKLDAEQEQRFERLADDLVMVDLHQHFMVLPEDLSQFDAYCAGNDFTWAYDAVRHGGWAAVTTANVLSCLGKSGELAFARFNDLVDEIGLMLADVAHHSAEVVRVATSDDILAARKSHRFGLLPSVEHLALDNDLHHLDVLYGLGVRIAGLTYSRRNLIGDGQMETSDCGLSEFGRAVVKRMNELGMVIDLSHAGDTTALEAIEASTDPCLFSHNAAYSVWPTARTRHDRELVACAQKGGLVAVTAVPNSLSDRPDQTIECVLDHYDYLIKLVGSDHVAIGTDTVTGDHVGLQLRMGKKPTQLPSPYLNGLESPADGMNIIRGLIARGHSDREVRQVAGENALALLHRVIG